MKSGVLATITLHQVLYCFLGRKGLWYGRPRDIATCVPEYGGYAFRENAETIRVLLTRVVGSRGLPITSSGALRTQTKLR